MEKEDRETHNLHRGPGGAPRLQVLSFRVDVESGPNRGESVALGGISVRIGTAADSDLVLSDLTASRRHTLLTLTDDGVLAEDLQSLNGTWLNGSRIRSAFVPDGGLLKIGTSALRVTLVTSRILLYPVEETNFHGLVGASQAMRDVFAMIKQLAGFDLPVAITGETGTGKELAARALHEAAPRTGRFVILDCGSILPELLRSELFGHEKGSFTGAERLRKGLLEEAAGGTVVLDEVGEIDLAIQPQLLRALETREVYRIGASVPVPVRFRLVSSTNRDLKAMSREGRFRQDLYYRLSSITIRLPSLRERTEDIPLLVDSFRRDFSKRHQTSLVEFSPDALAAMAAHDWPGNVRELRNLVESTCVMSPGQPVDASLVRKLLGEAATPRADPSPHDLEGVEKIAIEAALVAAGWNRVHAARSLRISRATLYTKIQRYGLVPPRKA